MTGQLARSILEHARQHGAPLEDVAGVIVAGLDAGASAKTTLIFLDRARRPALVAKVARDRTAEAGLVDEFEALRQMRGDVVSAAALQIPRALGLVRIDGRLALIMTGLDGEPMMSRYYANGHTDSAEDVGRHALTEWFGSVAPNAIVIGVDPDRELLLVHQLRRQGGADEFDVLRLG